MCYTEIEFPIKDGDLGEHRGCDGRQRVCEEANIEIPLEYIFNAACPDLERPK